MSEKVHPDVSSINLPLCYVMFSQMAMICWNFTHGNDMVQIHLRWGITYGEILSTPGKNLAPSPAHVDWVEGHETQSTVFSWIWWRLLVFAKAVLPVDPIQLRFRYNNPGPNESDPAKYIDVQHLVCDDFG